MFLNQKGHSDWSGLAWLFLFACLAVFLVEGGLITATILLWKNMIARIIFGILSIAGAIFIIHYVKDLL